MSTKADDTIHSQDGILLEKLTQTVLQNLENEQFGVEELSSQVGISRSYLHRKLKALEGKSVSQFVRYIRLSQAEGSYNMMRVPPQKSPTV